MNRVYGAPLSAVVCAGIANFVFGFIWYGALFGEAWGRQTGIAMGGDGGSVMLGSVVGTIAYSFLLALGVAYTLGRGDETSVLAGFKTAVLLALLLILPAHASKWAWQLKPVLFAIDASKDALSVIMSGLILGAWPQAVKADPVSA